MVQTSQRSESCETISLKNSPVCHNSIAHEVLAYEKVHLQSEQKAGWHFDIFSYKSEVLAEDSILVMSASPASLPNPFQIAGLMKKSHRSTNGLAEAQTAFQA